METSISFGYWLRRRRKALDLTQVALAQCAGCTADAIKKIEADLRRPSRELAERMADCLAVPADERVLFLQVARAKRSPDRLQLTDQPLTATPPAGASAGVPDVAKPMQALPTPTLPGAPGDTATFLLTDIQNSTTLWEQHPAAMAAALQRYDAIIRHAIAGPGGHLGQSFANRRCVVFAGANAALAAAIAAQRSLVTADWGLPAPLTVRLAIHSGEVPAHPNDILGQTLSRAERLLEAGHGGQIILSRATVELVRDTLPPGVTLRNLGEHRLNGSGRLEQIFQVVASDLPGDFSPLRTTDSQPNNLPAPPNLFVGRERERAALAELLRRPGVRFVTLTGPGGIGKTRLALAVAEDLLSAFPHGVWFVDLAPITEPELLAPRIARVLGITESGSRPLIESLYAYLRERRLLMLLDNLEQVNNIAPHVARLLAAAHGLTLLATSRVSLHLSAEYERRVSPLTLPEWKALPDVDRLAQNESVQLFVERAYAANATFALSAANAPAVAEICRCLDGLPLAIELAAARIKHVHPGDLLGQLQRRLAFLTDGPHDLPVRQQTLRATIAWSYQLLDPPAQQVFVRLAVFRGGCTPAAAAAVMGRHLHGFAASAYGDIEDVLRVLADNSLLGCTADPDATPRFTMLETVREYAFEQLVASGAVAAMQRRHTHYYVALVEEPWRRPTGVKRRQWLERIDAEYENLRAVLGRSASTAEGGPALLRLSAALWWYWYFRGMASEGSTWLQAALTQADALPPSAALQSVRCGAGVMAWALGDQATADEHLRVSIAGWRTLDDQRGLAYTLTFQGLIRQYRNDLAAARPFHEESVAIFQRGNDRWGLALALASLGDLCYFANDMPQARTLFAESIAIDREIMDGWSLAWAASGLGFVAYAEGEYAQAEQLVAESITLLRSEGSKLRLASTLNKQGNLFRLRGRRTEAAECYTASLALFRDLDTQLVIADPLHNLGFLALHEGDAKRAVNLFAECIAVAQAQQDWAEVAMGLGGLAAVAAHCGDAARAARLFAVMERTRTSTGETFDPVNRRECDRYCADVQRILGATRFAAIWAEGAKMDCAQLIGDTLKALQDQIKPRAPIGTS